MYHIFAKKHFQGIKCFRASNMCSAARNPLAARELRHKFAIALLLSNTNKTFHESTVKERKTEETRPTIHYRVIFLIHTQELRSKNDEIQISRTTATNARQDTTQLIILNRRMRKALSESVSIPRASIQRS